MESIQTIKNTVTTLETTHLFECDCLTCLNAISTNSKIEGRRIVVISEYGALKKVTVSNKSRKRNRWLEN